MAHVLLAPGERFEHTHDVVGYTELISGEVDFTLMGVTRRLVVGEGIEVPARESHESRNVGTVGAVLICKYPKPEPG